MIRRPPRYTRTVSPCTYTTLFRSNKPLTDHCGELMTAGLTSLERTGDSDFAKGRSALYLRQDRTFRGTENMSKASPASAAAAAATPADSTARFVWEDPLLLEEQPSAEERMARDAARAYCPDKLLHRLLAATPHAPCPPPTT